MILKLILVKILKIDLNKYPKPLKINKENKKKKIHEVI